MLHNVRMAGLACLRCVAAVLIIGSGASAATGSPWVRLHGHMPLKAIADAKSKGRQEPTTKVQLSFALPLRNEAALEDLLRHIYNPADPLYGHYLSPQEFADRFGPSQNDYDALVGYAQALGLTVTGMHSNRGLLNASGSAEAVEAAFNLHLNHYQAADGREFYAPDNEPEIPASIASRIIGVIGLDNAAVWHMHSIAVSAADMARISPAQIGTGPGSALAPNDILTAYNLKTVTANGSGQTIALFELDGYRSSDVTGYENYFGLPAVPLQNVLVDGFSGSVGSGASEVTLDIELQVALSPGASKIIVYEGPNSNTGVVDTYNKIATDNLAKQISTSWGSSEGQTSSIVISSENNIFRQMATQGQSIFAASGDSGAYDNGVSLSVDDPASQPYVSGVGGTQLFVNTGETYNHESSWNVNNTVTGGAGGGGVSSVWAIPSWQQGIASAASTVMRNVPDVSLNADQYTGYAIYFNGGWGIYGGTSCAAPLWAAFTARVNQQRVANGSATLGFANPSIYQLANSAKFNTDFNDVADGSTNLYYSAVARYDNSTGWGSFNGANLLADLAPTAAINRTLTVISTGTGSGTITATGCSLNWTGTIGTCTVNDGTSITLTGAANAGSTFIGWSNGSGSTSSCSGTGSCSFSITAGSGVTATFNLIPINAACGTDNGQSLTSTPVNLCSAGTTTGISGSGPWTWTCSGLYGGTNASCSANIRTYSVNFVSGGNGTLSGATSQTINYNGSGTAVTATPGTSYHFVNWTGTNRFVTTTTNPLTVTNVRSGMTITANFTHDAVNGACGTSNGSTFATAPATNLCSTGTTTGTSGSGPWTWICSGQYGGTNATCSAYIATSPSLTLSTLADGSHTNKNVLNIDGTVSDANGIRSVVISSLTATAVALNTADNINYTFSFPVTLVTGSNVITTVATDKAGNTATDTRTIVLDTTAPALALTSPADNSVTSSPTVTVSGTTDTTSTVLVSINSGPTATAGVNITSFSRLVSLATNTINTINVYAADLAGNTTSVKRTVTNDETNPSLAVTTPNEDMGTTQTSIMMSGTVSDLTNISLVVSCPTASVGVVSTPTTNTWSVRITNLQSGVNSITIQAMDRAGNSTSAIRNIVCTVTPVSINAVTSPTTTYKQTISGTREENATVAVVCPTATVGTVTYPSAMTWQTDITLMSIGTNTITATATDALGNVSSPITTVIVLNSTSLGVASGDTNGDGVVDTKDALLALLIAAGIETPTTDELSHGDVAPLVNGVPQPDGKIDIGDVVVILRIAVGLLTLR